jgi:hypothetical protein
VNPRVVLKYGGREKGTRRKGFEGIYVAVSLREVVSMVRRFDKLSAPQAHKHKFSHPGSISC